MPDGSDAMFAGPAQNISIYMYMANLLIHIDNNNDNYVSAQL